MTVAPSWAELRSLMATPRSGLRVSGTVAVTVSPDGEVGIGWTGVADQAPPRLVSSWDEAAGPGSGGYLPLTVHLLGERTRVDLPGGRRLLLLDGDHAWSFDREHLSRPVLTSTDRLACDPAVSLVRPPGRPLRRGHYDTGPDPVVGSAEFLGRPTWEAVSGHERGRRTVTVDARTGLVLRTADPDAVAQWTELREGPDADLTAMGWDGPVTPVAELDDAHRAAERAERERRLDWLRSRVAPHPLELSLAPDLDLHSFDDASGACVVTLGPLGLLSRRPRSGAGRPGETDGDGDRGGPVRRTSWSDDQWDWLLELGPADLSPDGLARLQHALRSVPAPGPPPAPD